MINQRSNDRKSMIKLGSLFVMLCMGLSACESQTSETQSQSSVTTAPLEETALNGRQLFFVCQACHSIEEGAGHKVGPNLYDIIDQPAASRVGYAYSTALQESNLVWNKGTLTGWIMGTETMLPNTWMAYHNHLTPAEVAQLVEYIASKSPSSKRLKKAQ